MIANGIVDEEFIPMKCVVCEGDEVSCGPSKTLTTDCPRNTTHCASTVTYWETVVEDSKLTGIAYLPICLIAYIFDMILTTSTS